MSENTLNISDSAYGEYATKLNITNREGFERLIESLNEDSVQRSCSGFFEYQKLKLIAKTLSSFDRVTFDEETVAHMSISDWELLSERIGVSMSGHDCMKWIFNGMIRSLAAVIDEDIRYGGDNLKYKNLLNFLCLLEVLEVKK